MAGAFHGVRKVTGMLRLHQGGRLQRTVTKAETKTCPLCAALNYKQNTQCRVCGWRGGFENDAAVTDYHWQRLTERYEEVRLEHLVADRAPGIGEFGLSHKTTLWQRVLAAYAAGCQTLRARWQADRVPPRPNTVLPPK